MHTTNLRKVGGSVMLSIPPALLKQLRLQAGASVSLIVDGGQLVVQAAPAPKYTLADLLAQCDPQAPLNAEDAEWLGSAPVGNELL